ncbi:uncharacterized protein ColSpa_12123 [Colletotrichum spaethianum]|uniref:BTB domain-containing protein n=1 Tax=Colletotrichum spaethianum TaxID=700344 RepID=A0AA37PGY5_9PEZI|nr:uncharacterized protein ColSpa_12123 [Colletotrichum spaethianum]GKT51942.1 hypothetical protein ColSpa_12123 [Colletotrichum spaethianum]
MKDSIVVGESHESTKSEAPDPKRRRLERTEPKALIVLDEYGDLSLYVGANHVDQPSAYLVCSKALARSSPVMKKILFSGFKELRPTEGGQGEWMIHLPDDQPAPMQLMLEIMHGDFGRVPETMALSDLHNCVVVMDKYDSISLTRPWIQAWLRSAKASGDHAKLLSVAWALGDMELYRTSSTHLIESSTINEEGDPVINLDSSTSGNEGGNGDGNQVSQSDLLVEGTAPLVPTSVIGE